MKTKREQSLTKLLMSLNRESFELLKEYMTAVMEEHQNDLKELVRKIK